MSDNHSNHTILGRYRLLERIGAGGMAEVYLAETSGPHGVVRRCIVKQILPGFSGRSEFANAFIDEARIGTTLSHPNLVTTLDFDEDDGRLFLVLEYVDGPDLSVLGKALARSGQRLPVEAACTILIGVLHGLGYAHKATDIEGRPLSIVHRDVNPPNILLSRSGTVKLADFGIARAASRLSQTRLGHLKGKVPYMSPEQAEGLRLDGRSDLFACGVVLWELCTGGRLFGGGDEMEVLRQVRQSTIAAPSTFADQVDHELDRICLKALERDRGKRYGTAEKFCSDLEAYRSSQFPGYTNQNLAALIEEYKTTWERTAPAREKTPVLGSVFNPSPETENTENEKPSVVARGRRRIFIYPVGIIVAVLLLFLFFKPGDSKQETNEKETGSKKAVLTVSGGDGAFILSDGVLLGRAPFSQPVLLDKKRQQLEMIGGRVVPFQTGTTFKPDKQKQYDGDRKLSVAYGSIRFTPQGIPSSFWIDDREWFISEDRIFLPAGIHRVTWRKGDLFFERIVRVPWYGEALVVLD